MNATLCETLKAITQIDYFGFKFIYFDGVFCTLCFIFLYGGKYVDSTNSGVFPTKKNVEESAEIFFYLLLSFFFFFFLAHPYFTDERVCYPITFQYSLK